MLFEHCEREPGKPMRLSTKSVTALFVTATTIAIFTWLLLTLLRWIMQKAA